MKSLISFLLVVTFFTFSGLLVPALAVVIPTFPVCANPGVNPGFSISDGIHGIAGRTENYSGADAVYSLSSDNALQCFCAKNGTGIQTNWWKIDQFSESELNVLESQGWIYIPNGALWGLAAGPYLAKNMDYSCQGGNSGNNSSSSDNNSSGSTSTNNPANGTGGQILGVTTGPVLGLADTGSLKLILAYFLGGIALIITGVFLRRKES